MGLFFIVGNSWASPLIRGIYGHLPEFCPMTLENVNYLEKKYLNIDADIYFMFSLFMFVTCHYFSI
jgi:hypothetical protein